MDVITEERAAFRAWVEAEEPPDGPLWAAWKAAELAANLAWTADRPCLSCGVFDLDPAWRRMGIALCRRCVVQAGRDLELDGLEQLRGWRWVRGPWGQEVAERWAS